MDKIRFDFQNIGLLEKASLDVNLNCLNIKYGSNGIGKTTIIKALKCKYGVEGSNEDFDSSDYLNSIVSLNNSNKKPVVSPDGAVHSTLVYDRHYFSMLFKNESDVLNDTYRLVVKSKEYEKALNQLRSGISSIVNYASDSKFDPFIQLSSNLNKKEKLVAMDAKGKKVKKTDSLFKSYATVGAKGVSLSNESQVKEYSIYVSSDFASTWLGWIEKYKSKILEVDGAEVCPFCGQKFAKENFTLKKNLELLKTEIGKSSEITSHNEEQKMIIDLASYCSVHDTQELLKINSIERPILEVDLELLDKKRKEAKVVANKIEQLRRLDGALLLKQFESSKEDDAKRIEVFKNKLSALKIDTCFHVNSENGDIKIDNLISKINSKIDDLINDIESLVATLISLNKTLQDKIKGNEKIINDFLLIAGLPYKVQVTENSDESFSTILKFLGSDNIVRNRLDYLSFGEANAFALILFAIEARNSKSLIVLDDLVSSFDSNKRYAIYDYLFDKSNKLLYGKTVLLMTHDFHTVVTFTKSKKFNNTTIKFSYLLNVNNVLLENSFEEKDICSSILWYKEYAKNSNNDLYSRVVAIRRIVEIERGKECDFYNYLSSLVHCKDSPKYRDHSADFSEKSRTICDNELTEYLNYQCDYDSILKKISDSKYLIESYDNQKTSKFGKSCITRLLVEKYKTIVPSVNSGTTNLVAWNFMCESFHVETQYIYSIMGINDQDIPNYIISLCDSIISKIRPFALK